MSGRYITINASFGAHIERLRILRVALHRREERLNREEHAYLSQRPSDTEAASRANTIPRHQWCALLPGLRLGSHSGFKSGQVPAVTWGAARADLQEQHVLGLGGVCLETTRTSEDFHAVPYEVLTLDIGYRKRGSGLARSVAWCK